MSVLTPLNSYLGKYYSELLYSAGQDKYKDSCLDQLFEQRFRIQNNKPLMVVNPHMEGLSVVVLGNEIHVSQDLYDHENILIQNSLGADQMSLPSGLYNPDIVPSLAYLICQNQTTIQVIGELEEPIYIKYRCDYETFYNSVLFVSISNDLGIEIVEEIESLCALNSVINYILHPGSRLGVNTFYNNRKSGTSLLYRNVIAREYTSFSHTVLGKPSAGIVDETKLHPHIGSKSYFNGLISADEGKFHSILYIAPESHNYTVDVNYRNIIGEKTKTTYFPIIIGREPEDDGASISVIDMILKDVPEETRDESIEKFTKDILDRVTLERVLGTQRFYNNKSKFLIIP